MSDATHIPDRRFPSTNWNLVNQARSVSAADGLKALDTLVRRYRPALMAHLVNIKRIPRDHAEDLIQGFLAHKILAERLLHHADEARGKFRTFLLTALEHYTYNEFRREKAAKRSPGEAGHLNVDDVAETLASPAGAHDDYDLAWAQQVVEEALRRVKKECETTGRPAFWSIFEARVVGPILHGEPAEGYDTMVKRLGIASPMQAANGLVTAKRMFERNLRAVILEYVEDEQAVDREISELRAILGRFSG